MCHFEGHGSVNVSLQFSTPVGLLNQIKASHSSQWEKNNTENTGMQTQRSNSGPCTIHTHEGICHSAELKDVPLNFVLYSPREQFLGIFGCG